MSHTQDAEEFDVEVECGPTRNDASGTTVSISETGWEDDESSFAHRHGGEGFVPSANDLSGPDLEGKGLIPIARTIKLLFRVKVVQPSRIMGLDHLARPRNPSRSLLRHLVQQSRFRGGKF
eukprot:scaffold32239_cov54-Attheya_sp.AAC.2